MHTSSKDHALAAKRSEASYARKEKRLAGVGKQARNASKAYNKAARAYIRRKLRAYIQ